MRILIAPDKFKGSLSAREVSLAIERGLLSGYRALDGEPSDPPQSRIGPQADDGSEMRLHQAAEEHPKNYPNPQIFIQPIGDGGEGTMQLLCESRSECKTIQTKATGSLGAISDCEFYETVEGGLKKAYIEMASINGLALLDPSQRDPEHSLSTGTGELIVQAMERGAAEIYVGLGGSATVDGGAGALEALGFIFRDRSNRILAPGESIFGATDRSETVADALLRIASLTIPRVMSARLFAVVDVDSPLNGPGGAITSFALQKGLAPERLELYGRALEHFSAICERDLDLRSATAAGVAGLAEDLERPQSLSVAPGTGAAGGLGFALALAGAKILPGFPFFSNAVGLQGKMYVDLVITGEGKMDKTSLVGKGPGGIARMAREAGLPCIAICGKVEDRETLMESGLFQEIIAISDGVSATESMKNAAALIEKAAASVARRWNRD